MRHTPRSLAPILLAVLLFAGTAIAQNQIVGIDPATAEPGTTGLVVTFALDTDSPPAPPAGVVPSSVTIGSIVGTNLTHDSSYTVTATFDIPADEAIGAKSCTISWAISGVGTLAFSSGNGFAIESDSAPPAITVEPRSKTVYLGRTVTLSAAAAGTAPLSYQWTKDGAPIAGATAASYCVVTPTAGNAGSYACTVSNPFGSATTSAATLRVVDGAGLSYPILSSMQDACYDDTSAIPCPTSGEAWYGQDAQQSRFEPAFTVSADGLTVYEAVTGLTWTRSPDRNRDGTIDASDKLTYDAALDYPVTLNAESFGGYSDWRLPTIQELYSLIDFRGSDPSAESGDDTSGLTPFVDTSVFEFGYGDTSAGERVIDAQFASATPYVSTTMGGFFTDFGVNLADGRIKGYGTSNPSGYQKTFYVYCVRGPIYGVNDFVPQSDGTVVDRATGLQWLGTDIGPVDWKEALAAVQAMNDAATDGYTDWRMPTVKELQSLIDYDRSPDTTSSAAIDPLFSATAITDEACVTDYPFYWSSTTHASSNGDVSTADYMAFGRALGYMSVLGGWVDAHGAGAQRSDPKTGTLTRYSYDGCGYYNPVAPQGDNVRIDNYVRPVRGGEGFLVADFSFAPATGVAAGDSVHFDATASGATSPYVYEWSFDGDSATGASVDHTFAAGSHTVTLTVHSELLGDAPNVVVTKTIDVGDGVAVPTHGGRYRNES